MRKASFPLYALCALLCASSVQAEFFVGPGATGSSILKIPIGARAAGLAGSYAAVEGDVNTLEYNPAGLVGIQKRELTLSHVNFIEDTSFQSIAWATPLRSRGGRAPALGLHYRLLSTDDEGRNSVGQRTSDFDIRDQAFRVGVAFPFGPSLALAAAGTYLSHKIDDESITNYAGDAGLLWKPGTRFSLGASILNAGPSRAFINESDPLPTTLRVGAGYKLKRLLIVSDVSQGRDEILNAAGGVEFSFGRFLALRAGTVFQTTLEFAGGLSLQLYGKERKRTAQAQARAARQQSSHPTLTQREQVRKTIISSTLYQVAENLTQQYEAAGSTQPFPLLAVFPYSASQQDVSEAFSRELRFQFSQINEFTLMEIANVQQILNELQIAPNQGVSPDKAQQAGYLMEADYVITGTIEPFNENYMVTTQLVRVADNQTIGSSIKEVARNLFEKTGAATPITVPARKTLRQAPSNDLPLSAVDFGLDYAIQTRNDLGVTHAITLKILY